MIQVSTLVIHPKDGTPILFRAEVDVANEVKSLIQQQALFVVGN
jgi:hypothetical protein